MPDPGIPAAPPSKTNPNNTNRGFDNRDPQKDLAGVSEASSGGNFADEPERTSINADTLRDAIDRGETQDKVNAADPAVAPLGTDAEAAGTPIRLDDPEDPPNADRGKPDQLQRRPKLPL